MDTPRSSSNGFLTVVCLAILFVCGYKVYKDRQVQPVAAQPTPTRAPKKPVEYLIAPSRVIEPVYVELFADLNKDYPEDLVPKMVIARERILDRQAHTDQSKKTIYDPAIKLLDAMIDVGEERTKALEALLKTAAQPRTSLETARTPSSSTDPFLASQLKRSGEALKARKPALDRLFAQVRTVERDWNSRLPKGTLSESYDIPLLAPAMITANEGYARNNPLEQKAYDQRRATYSWRRAYYDRYSSQPRSY